VALSRASEVAEAIRTYPGVSRKSAISGVTSKLPTDGFAHVIAAEGEDAAVLDYGEFCVLFAADGIMESLVRDAPYYAGYFGVLVNVNDIAAMGGRAMGMTDVLSISDKAVRDEVLRGMAEGVRQFGVPFVGGHTHPDCGYNALDVSVVGKVAKEDVMLSSTARPGDDIVMVSDLAGHYPDAVPYAYVSTEHRSDDIVRRQMEAAAEVAERHLAHACKDISNPGSVGTLGMMMECSGTGCTVDLDRIPRPDGVDEIRWVTTYQGCGFVFSCSPENSAEIISIFEAVSCSGAVVGRVDDTGVMRLEAEGESSVVFDFSKDVITGIRSKKR